MPILAAGNPKHSQRGFTLLELLVVLAIVALISVAVGFAMRDATQTRLEREGLRLAALLEAGRMRSQVSGVAVRWRPLDQGFRFEGLVRTDVAEDDLPQAWLDADTVAVLTAAVPRTGNVNLLPNDGAVLLGPEPFVAAQSVVLSSRTQPDKQIRIGTDGVRPFAIQADPVP